MKYRKYGRVGAAFAGTALKGMLSRYMQRARSGPSTARKTRFRTGRSYTKTRYRSRRDGQPITNQYDYKVDYIKRRATRASYRRRRYSRRITNIVRNGMVGTTHVLRRSVAHLTTPINESNFNCYGLNGLNGISSDEFNPTSDIGNIIFEMDRTAWNDLDTAGAITRNNNRLYVHSCTMENTIRNDGANDAIVEAYFIRGRIAYQKSASDSPTGLYVQGFDNQGEFTNPEGGTTLSLPQLRARDIGVTPFQNQRFCQTYTIVKRLKFVIPVGGEITHTVHGPSGTYRASHVKNHITDKRYYGILYQQQGGPIVGTPTNTLAQPTSCTYLSIRRYRVKMLSNNLARDLLDVSNTIRPV